MKINHIAIWCRDLEKMKLFYERYFNGKAGEKYANPQKGFSAYFLRFSEGCRLELMHRDDITDLKSTEKETTGLAHLAFSVGSRERVNQLTEQLRADGLRITGEPRTTGDGYYESTILDPEGNRIEITS
ncbi:MAG: VOC family protein [Bacteroidales bacterium]